MSRRRKNLVRELERADVALVARKRARRQRRLDAERVLVALEERPYEEAKWVRVIFSISKAERQ